MRKNIFTKTMLRQPLRTAVLVILIALAAFLFVLRTVEYYLVRSQISLIGESYRTVGFISHPYIFGDVTEAAAILTQSPYVAREDYRRAAEGFLVDMHNADFIGMHVQVTSSRSARHNQQRMTETYFIAYLQNIETTTTRIRLAGWTYSTTQGINLQMQIYEVLVGHPEYVVEGQTITLYYSKKIENCINAFQNIEVGQRYLIRGAYVREYPSSRQGRFIPDPINGPTTPRIGYDGNILHIWPLYEDGPVEQQVWFHPVPDGYDIAFNLPHLAHIPDEIEMLQRDHSSIQLQGTADMTAMPEIGRAIRLVNGRLIDYDDYLAANPVAVIDHTFARARGLSIGSTFTVTIPRQQHFVGRVGLSGFIAPLIRTDRNYPSRFYDAYEVELEVVGITMFEQFTRYTAQSLFVFIPNSVLPQDIGVYWRRWGWEYLPGYTEAGERNRAWVELPTIQLGYNHIPDTWYSFELTDSRYENQFYDYYRRYIHDLDMDLVMYFADPFNFWLSAAPIILTITFNLVLFWAVFALVLGLVTFLYLRQKRREIAIIRAVGRSAKRVLLQLIVTAVMFGVPAIAIGGSAAWHFAIREAENTLAMFEEAYAEAVPLTAAELRWQDMFGDRPMSGNWEVGINVNLTVEMAMYWLGIFMAVVFALMILMVILGGARILRQPVLVQLQSDRGATPAFLSRKDAADDISRYDTRENRTAPLPPSPVYLPRSAKEKIYNDLRYIRRHIARSPVKTALGLAVTLFFVITLGWLQESIDRTSLEIDRMNVNTIIRGEVIQNPLAPGNDRYLNDIVRPATVSRMLNTGYIYSTALEAGFIGAFVLPLRDGTMPSHWRLLIGYNAYTTFRMAGLYTEARALSASTFDYVLGISDIDMFMQAHTVAAAGRTFDDTDDFDVHDEEVRAARLRNIDIEFAPGFCFDIFRMTDYTPGEIVPIVVSPYTLAARGLSLGDEAVMGYRRYHGVHASGPRDLARARESRHIYVVIAGVHNRQIHHENMQDAVLIPLPVLEHHIWRVQYISMDFAINPAYNREINRIRDVFERIINPLPATEFLSLTPLSLVIHDREFRSVIGSLEQSMLLLQLLYPVAVGLALVIGSGIALLLVLQGTKNAAIMRVLGASKFKACFVAWAEQILLCLMGLCAGAAVLTIMGRGIGMVLVLSGMYLAGVALGSLVGAVIITVKAPIEHLQVRE